MRWKQSYSITFVIPELRRMAIWWIPGDATPEALKRAGDHSGGIYRAIEAQGDPEGLETVLWKRQQQIGAYVEDERLKFALLATTNPETTLVDLIRRGKKKADRELARARYFKKP